MAVLTARERSDGLVSWIGLELFRSLGIVFRALTGAINLRRQGGGCRGFFLMVSSAMYACWAQPASAQGVKAAPEYSLKAAYLFNFTQFVEWPSNSFATAAAPLVIGVLGEDPFGGALDQAVKDKTVRGRSFEIRRYKQVGEVHDCHVLFVCASETRRVTGILAATRKSGILTVSDIDRFAEQGGVIDFTMENNKIRFQVNLNAAAAAELKISAQLLHLARKVWRAGEGSP
jgi:hypothetical protein